jgi:hypothetical protein
MEFNANEGSGQAKRGAQNGGGAKRGGAKRDGADIDEMGCFALVFAHESCQGGNGC